MVIKLRLLCALVILMSALLPAIPANAVAKLAQGKPAKPLCAQQQQAAFCLARQVYEPNGVTPLSTATYQFGYQPNDLLTAYKLPPAPAGNFAWNGKTVAVVAAYDNPQTANDLVAYRKQFNLPLCATNKPAPTPIDLTSCFFKKVNQNGQTSPLPQGDMYWGGEIDIDIQMVSAICPNCKILLVEANDAMLDNIGKAVDRAAAMGATAINNSYGTPEFNGQMAYNHHYNHPGVAITASSGDAGYGVIFPAASQYVTAVGGTSLLEAPATSRGWQETAWAGSGSGCSQFAPRPNWQPAIGTCKKRVTADVSAIGDPVTGVAVYDSYGAPNGQNWHVFGGTSVAAPIIASVYALANNKITYGERPYAHGRNLFDVTLGSNGICTQNGLVNLRLCTAGVGYDGPTGLGSPNGLAAF